MSKIFDDWLIQLIESIDYLPYFDSVIVELKNNKKNGNRRRRAPLFHKIYSSDNFPMIFYLIQLQIKCSSNDTQFDVLKCNYTLFAKAVNY